MNEKAFLYLKNWFHQYVARFYSMDEQLQFHVRLKEDVYGNTQSLVPPQQVDILTDKKGSEFYIIH